MGNHIGSTFYFSDAVPVSNDAAGFEALTWTKVDGVQQLPQLGLTHSMIDVPDLQKGFITAMKGAGQGVDTTAAFHATTTTGGHPEIEALAISQKGLGSIKIVEGSGADQAPVAGNPVEYAHGIIHSFQPNQGDVTSFKGFTIGFRQNDFTVKATQPA